MRLIWEGIANVPSPTCNGAEANGRGEEMRVDWKCVGKRYDYTTALPAA